jgi:muramidase (phage lysozyme)
MTPNEVAFLRMIAWSEGTLEHPLTKCGGYDVIVTGVDGKPEIFSNYSDHPFAFRPPKRLNQEGLFSTASGRYQLLFKYFEAYKKSLHLPDFSPKSQDIIALQQIKECGAINNINSDNISQAIRQCSNIWASLPGNSYGQRQNELDNLVEKFQEFVG